MPRMPQRSSLVDQVAASIREAVEEGKWLEELPGEHDLCAQLQVSRMTLRGALDILESQRWIQRGGSGKRTRILSIPAEAPRSRGTEVRMVSGLPLSQIVGVTRDAINEVHAALEAAGFTFRFEYRAGLATATGEAAFRRLTSAQTVAGWMPVWASADLLQRFAAASGLPAMTLGTPPVNSRLLTVEYDTAGIGRHAGLQFLRRGHRHLAFVRPDNDFPGDLSVEAGMMAAAATRGGRVTTLTYSAAANDLRQRMEEVLKRTDVPTAWCVAQPNSVWPVINVLLLAGRRIPQDAAVISRGDDLFLETAVPSIARYHLDGRLLGRTASRLMLQLLRQPGARPRRRKLTPDFLPGESLG
jgi:DNA-binding LacI/PurR family transcriptional regulator